MTAEKVKIYEMEVKIRWGDCFKFWISGFIFNLLLVVLLLMLLKAWIGL